MASAYLVVGSWATTKAINTWLKNQLLFQKIFGVDMYCTRCGTRNPDTSVNCFNCGSSIDAYRGECAAATEMGIKPATIDSAKKGAQTTYGAKNKLVTAEEAESARARLRTTISELDMGAPHKATGK